jgi:hypothetical protein
LAGIPEAGPSGLALLAVTVARALPRFFALVMTPSATRHTVYIDLGGLIPLVGPAPVTQRMNRDAVRRETNTKPKEAIL